MHPAFHGQVRLGPPFPRGPPSAGSPPPAPAQVVFGLSVLSVTGTSREGRGGSCEKLFLAIPFPWDSEPLGFSSPPPSRPFLGPWHARCGQESKPDLFPSPNCVLHSRRVRSCTQLSSSGTKITSFTGLSRLSAEPVVLHCPRVVGHPSGYFPYVATATIQDGAPHLECPP